MSLLGLDIGGEIWKAVGESGKPLKKVRKPLKKAESRRRK
jgi:hypothetical protein